MHCFCVALIFRIKFVCYKWILYVTERRIKKYHTLEAEDEEIYCDAQESVKNPFTAVNQLF